MIKLISVTLIIFSVLSFRTAPEVTTSSNKTFTQFIVNDVNSIIDAKKIDKYMRAQAGVLMSRMDINSKKYLIFFKSDMNYDQAYFESTFKKLGFNIKCFRQGTHGVDKIINQKLDCQ